jgi:hypothetical protein
MIDKVVGGCLSLFVSLVMLAAGLAIFWVLSFFD